jgi:superoxide dismutase
MAFEALGNSSFQLRAQRPVDVLARNSSRAGGGRLPRFNLSGHVLHTVFWENLSLDAGGEPTGALAEQLGVMRPWRTKRR